MIRLASSASRAQWTRPPARVTESSNCSKYSSRWRVTRSLRARPASLRSSQSGISPTASARLRRMVRVALPRLRLSCESERLSLADCSNVGVGPGENASEGFVATLYLPTLAGEYLGEVHGPDPGAEPAQPAADVHQARVVPGRADLGLRVENVSELVREHGRRSVGVLD